LPELCGDKILKLSLFIFQVKANPEGLHCCLKNCSPIIIGTIPLWKDTVPYQGLTFPAAQQIMPAPSAPQPETGIGFVSSLPYPNMCKSRVCLIVSGIANEQLYQQKEIMTPWKNIFQ
jgi:hypothetical protein